MPEPVCNVEMQDLKKSGKCSNNSSGVKTMYYALREDVKTLPTIPKNKTSFDDFTILSEGGITAGTVEHSIEMKPGKCFFQFYTGKDLGELKYTSQGVSGAKSFNANLEVFHPGFKKEILGFMGATQNEELILLCKLNNGDTHLLGDIERGAEFGDTAEATSGKAVTDPNGATINFTYDTPTAQIYMGDMASLLQPENSGG